MLRPGDTLSVKGEEKTKTTQRVKKIDILDIGMSCFLWILLFNIIGAFMIESLTDNSYL